VPGFLCTREHGARMPSNPKALVTEPIWARFRGLRTGRRVADSMVGSSCQSAVFPCTRSRCRTRTCSLKTSVQRRSGFSNRFRLRPPIHRVSRTSSWGVLPVGSTRFHRLQAVFVARACPHRTRARTCAQARCPCPATEPTESTIRPRFCRFCHRPARAGVGPRVDSRLGDRSASCSARVLQGI